MFDTKLNVPISTLTGIFTRYAKRATTNQEKAYLLEIVQATGDAVSTQHPGVNREEFILACGVSPNWAQQAA